MRLAWSAGNVFANGITPAYWNLLFYGLSFGIGAAANDQRAEFGLGFIRSDRTSFAAPLTGTWRQLPARRKIPSEFLTNASMKFHHAKVPMDASGFRFPRAGEVWHEPAGQVCAYRDIGQQRALSAPSLRRSSPTR